MIGPLGFFFFFLGIDPASGSNMNGPSRFSCLNDVLSLRVQLVEQYSYHMDGYALDRQKFINDHQTLKNFLWPSPYFPENVIRRVDFYKDKLIPAYKHFNGLQVGSANKGIGEVRRHSLESRGKKQIKRQEYVDTQGGAAWEKKLRGMDAQRFYGFIFSQAKSDLVLIKELSSLSSTPVVSEGRFSNRYLRFRKDKQRASYFSLCATLFEADAIQSPDPSVQSGPRRRIPDKSSQGEEVKTPRERILAP